MVCGVALGYAGPSVLVSYAVAAFRRAHKAAAAAPRPASAAIEGVHD